MADLEAQHEPAKAGPASPARAPLSPLARLSLHRRADSARREAMRTAANAKDITNQNGGALGGTNAAAGPSTPPMSPTGATIFSTLGRPDLEMMDSYEVGGDSGSHIFGSPGRTRTEPLRETQRTNPGLFKTSTLRPQRSQSQRKSISIDDRIGKARRSSSRPRQAHRSEDEAMAAHGPAANKEGQTEVTNDTQPPSATALPTPLKERLSELHAKHPYLKALPSPLLPIVAFPGQGTGRMSEFDQAAPIWAQMPYKWLYFAYFGLSVGLVYLPWFALSSIAPSQRERPSWTWKKSTLIKLYRHGTRLTFRTHTALSRDLSKEVPHSKTVRAKFIWVNGLPDELVRGELRRGLDVQGLNTVRTCGFWYGERDGGGGVGQKATIGEKVVYHLHGGAYWIGTAHEKDVTSAVNVQLLRALNDIYSKRMPMAGQGARPKEGIPPSPHPPSGGPGAGRGGVCKRAFSLDYRLCVPGQPAVGSFPAPLADAVAGYLYLVRECCFEPSNIIVAGDSAGGNLALAMCRYLRDEKIEAVPGAMILLSPWADTSRSHSGPTSAPNKLSTVYLNRKTDIIAPSLAFRNTAVSALIGNMPARETYKNPYLSSISLQLPAKDGGAGPSWGFDGFPRRIYVCTGTAEISYDQHVTLAYRLASGARMRVPIHAGDKCHKDADPYEMAARLQYPRPDDHEVTLWPSAQTTPADEPLPPPSDGWTELQHMSSGQGGKQSNGDDAHVAKEKHAASQGNGQPRQVEAMDESVAEAKSSHARDTRRIKLDSVSKRMKSADGYLPTMSQLRAQATRLTSLTKKDDVDDARDEPHSASLAVDTDVAYAAGEGPNSTTVKEKDTEVDAHATHKEARQHDIDDTSALSPSPSGGANATHEAAQSVEQSATPARDRGDAPPVTGHTGRRTPPDPESYFDLGAEDRTVVLDECIDGIHDYTLFDWFEPERGRTWARIAQWVDEEV